jgi:hypothetical protein
MFPSDGIETIYIWVDENSNHRHHNGDRNRDLDHPAHIWRVLTLGASLSSGNRESLCEILFATAVSPSWNRNLGCRDCLDKGSRMRDSQREHSWPGGFDFPALCEPALRRRTARGEHRAQAASQINAPLRVMCSRRITADYSRRFIKMYIQINLHLGSEAHGPLRACASPPIACQEQAASRMTPQKQACSPAAPELRRQGGRFSSSIRLCQSHANLVSATP